MKHSPKAQPIALREAAQNLPASFISLTLIDVDR
jgi:hypothetical protein